MKKKLIFLLVCFFLVVSSGWYVYTIRYKHSLSMLQNMQKNLTQIVGSQGYYTYSKASVLRTSQTVSIHDMNFSFQDHSQLQIRRLRIIPASGMKIAKLVAKDISWRHGSYEVKIKNLYLYNVVFPDKPRTRPYSFQDILDTSFQQGGMGIVEAIVPSGYVKVANIQIKHIHQQGSYLLYRLRDISYFPKMDGVVQTLENRTYVQQFTISVEDDRPMIHFQILPYLSERKKTVYSIKDLKAYAHSALPYLDCAGIQVITVNQGAQVEGNGRVDKIEYQLDKNRNVLYQFLQRLGYSRLSGYFQFHVLYFPARELLTLQSLHYQGNDFVNVFLNSQLSIRLDINHGFTYEASLKKIHMTVADTGLRNHFLKESAAQLQVSERQALDRIVKKLDSAEKGKDFELDYQFYKSLAQVIKRPGLQMKIIMDFPQEETVNAFMTTNFLELFKLVNKGNMQVMAVQKE